MGAEGTRNFQQGFADDGRTVTFHCILHSQQRIAKYGVPSADIVLWTLMRVSATCYLSVPWRHSAGIIRLFSQSVQPETWHKTATKRSGARSCLNSTACEQKWTTRLPYRTAARYITAPISDSRMEWRLCDLIVNLSFGVLYCCMNWSTVSLKSRPYITLKWARWFAREQKAIINLRLLFLEQCEEIKDGKYSVRTRV